MRYVCSHCGTVVESDEPPAKCPNCLRKHGIIPEEESSSKKRKNKKAGATDQGKENRAMPWKTIAIATAALLLLGGMGLWWWHGRRSAGHRAKTADHRLGPQDPRSLQAAMVQAGAPKLPIPFAQNQRVAEWARKHIQGGDLKAKAHSLQKALHDLVDGKTCRHPGRRITPNTLLTAQGILSHAGPARPCHSFALSALGVAAARSVGMKAVLAELYAAVKADGTQTIPLDPTGGQGRFGVAILSSGYKDAKPLAILDPLSSKPSQTGSYQFLDDLTALASYLNLKAQALGESDPPTARMLADAASKLGPGSASVQCGVGKVLIALGGLSEGTDAVLKAVNLRNDAPRQLCLASAKLYARDVTGAMSALKAATKKCESYASAYLLQARIMLAMGQPAKASELLDRAEQHRPGMRPAKVLRAMLTAMQGQIGEATASLEQMLKEQPDDADAFGALWQIYVSTGMTDQADKLAKKFASHMPAQAAAEFLAKMKEQRKAIAKMQQAAAAGQSPSPTPPGGAAATAPDKSTPTSPLPSPGQGPLNAPPPNLDFKLKAPTGSSPSPHKGPKLDLNM